MENWADKSGPKKSVFLSKLLRGQFDYYDNENKHIFDVLID
jgi:hypothetical protein